MRTRSILAAIAAVIVLAGCATVRADVAATVHGDEIPLSQLETIVNSQIIGAGLEGGRASPDMYAELGQLQREVLSQLIQDRIVARAAEDLGIEVPEQEVDEQFEALAAQFGGVEPLRDELEARGMTEDDLRDQLVAFVRRERIAEHFAGTAEVSEEEIQEVYEQRLEERYRTASTSHILVETEEEAEAILDAIGAGEDFAELAEQHSIDEFSAVRGGDLGENPRGQFVEPFDDAVWAADEGEIVGPVETQFGYHVIRVDGFREQPLVEVQDEIRDELRGRAASEAFEAWMAEIGAAVEVEVNPRIGAWDEETGSVVPRDPTERRAPFDVEVVAPDDSPEIPPTED